MTDKPSVDTAYALKGAENVKALYRDWAATYDTDFIADMGYIYPREVVQVFLDHLSAEDTPVLDIGCGSGAVADALRPVADIPVDGLDISPEMLAVAEKKGLYGTLIEGDLLGRVPVDAGHYGALLSAGTFTHGHVGPEALDEVLRMARPGALFCLGINGAYFEAHGFGAAFDALEKAGRITDLTYADCPVYEAENHDHADTRALVAVFRKAV